MWSVYLLRCADQSIYTGCTQDLKNRIHQHMNGEVNYTKGRLPIQLVTSITFSEKKKAYDFERYLKSGSGIAFRNKRLV